MEMLVYLFSGAIFIVAFFLIMIKVENSALANRIEEIEYAVIRIPLKVIGFAVIFLICAAIGLVLFCIFHFHSLDPLIGLYETYGSKMPTL